MSAENKVETDKKCIKKNKLMIYLHHTKPTSKQDAFWNLAQGMKVKETEFFNFWTFWRMGVYLHEIKPPDKLLCLKKL